MKKTKKRNTDYNPHKNPAIQCTWYAHSQPEKEMLSSDCESSSPSTSGSKPVLASPLLRGREIWRVDNGSRDTKPTLAEKWPNVGTIATCTNYVVFSWTRPRMVSCTIPLHWKWLLCSVGHAHLWYHVPYYSIENNCRVQLDTPTYGICTILLHWKCTWGKHPKVSI